MPPDNRTRKPIIRFSLRSLLLLVTVIAFLLGAALLIERAVERWVEGEYKKVFDEMREKQRLEGTKP